DTAQLAFRDLDETMLCELRGSGGLTVLPPSTHKETGESIEWEALGEITEVALDDLVQGIRGVAVAALLARHWPAASWHNATLALCGGLLRDGLDVQRVQALVEGIGKAAGAQDAPGGRNGCVRSTDERLRSGQQTRGWKSFIKILGDRGREVVTRIRLWLGVSEEKGEEEEGGK